MPATEFLKPRLVGRRFDGAEIPLSFLQDLSALERLIVDVAKAKYRERYSTLRVPRGFTDAVSLKLSGVEDGSAMPVIKLVVAAMALFGGSAVEASYGEARDAFIAAIGQADRGESITALSPPQLEHFQKLGRGLGDKEAIEFAEAGRPTPAFLTKEIRRTLILASSPSADFTDIAFVRGRILEFNARAKTFEIEPIDGTKIVAPFTAEYSETVFDLASKYDAKPHAIVTGVARFDRAGRLKRFESIDEVAELDPLDFHVRLAEITKMKDGWLNGDGVAPSPTSIAWLRDSLQKHYPDDLELPHLYATEDGGIRAEWLFGRNDISLEIEFDNFTGYWHELNLDTKVDGEQTFALVTEDGWSKLISSLRTMSRVTA